MEALRSWWQNYPPPSCAHLGIMGELRHADYIANWIELLKEDDRAIFTAASKASQAAEYLRMFSEVVVPYE
jgi:antirestriction protein ArdC